MAITDLISGLEAAMAETQDRLTIVVGQIGELEQERGAISIAPPHADDIIASYMRGLDSAVSSFEARLAWNLNDANVRDPGAAASVARGAAQLLMIHQQPPATSLHYDPAKSLIPPSGLADRQSPLDAAALTYFLRDLIAAQIPGLVAKFCPTSKNGMKQAERARLLADVDRRLSELHKERDELQSHLQAARKAVRPH
jgi:hypothetical protein